jgi:N-acetylmuramoyl-L-alanine amidase
MMNFPARCRLHRIKAAAAALLFFGLGGRALAFTTVVIDAGHGGKDPGCVWNGMYEKTLCLDVAKRLKDLLREREMRVVMTRDSDRFLELHERAVISNRQENAVFVSIHFNAAKDRSISGFEVHYRSPRGKKLADAIGDGISKAVKTHRRDGDWQDYKVLRETRAPAVLVECGFISHKGEAERCGTRAHRQALAKGIAAGILAMKTKL